MSDYDQFKSGPSEDGMAKLATLAEDLQAAMDKAESLAEDLKAANKKVREYSERIIPETMEEVGVEKFTAKGGLEISIQEVVSCSIPKANHAAAMQWLDDNGHGGLIKRRVLVDFSREQEEAATNLEQSLKGHFDGVVSARKVEPMTLKAFIRQELEEGVDFPMDLFGARRFARAKVKVPKK